MSTAEEYYSRAILADPKDGEVLSQYANVVWVIHLDEDRASSYFERAVHAAPADSHVHAAYAKQRKAKKMQMVFVSSLAFPKRSLGFCKCIDTEVLLLFQRDSLLGRNYRFLPIVDGFIVMLRWGSSSSSHVI
ncbi:tetratricopeptide repeat (TPR)-like superfamily protein [Actinidia rufa]|uniref:Tetratricopeptide repeat (TPR)-like superfamily protein n=1 Tax=Actinidia rufa TaxID=165716 RepID=A0A7J0HAZ2_9ERIC|nr:tetratricopeptide repeat (TPR)-like superfamily protein [Actinidia rufa]